MIYLINTLKIKYIEKQPIQTKKFNIKNNQNNVVTQILLKIFDLVTQISNYLLH